MYIYVYIYNYICTYIYVYLYTHIILQQGIPNHKPLIGDGLSHLFLLKTGDDAQGVMKIPRVKKNAGHLTKTMKNKTWINKRLSSGWETIMFFYHVVVCLSTF